MGRPIKKSRIHGAASGFGGDVAGKIAVTAYRPSGGSKVDSTTAYIVSQRGSRLFKIHLDDSSEAVYELKAVAPASLANTSNQFCVMVTLNDSTRVYVDRFYNRTIHYVDTSGDAGTCTYTLGTEGTDEQKAGAGIGSIDVR
jgi:hypothetical protein